MKLIKSKIILIIAIVTVMFFAIAKINKEKWEGPDSVSYFGGKYQCDQTGDFFVSFVSDGPMSFSSGYQMLNLYDKNNNLIKSIETHPWYVNAVYWEKSVPVIHLNCAHKECGCEESKIELMEIKSIKGYTPKWNFADIDKTIYNK